MKSPEIHIFWYQFLTWILLNFSRQISQHLLAGRLLQWWDHPHVQRKDRHDRGRALWIASALQVSFHLPIFQGFSGGTATETDGGSLWLFWLPVLNSKGGLTRLYRMLHGWSTRSSSTSTTSTMSLTTRSRKCVLMQQSFAKWSKERWLTQSDCFRYADTSGAANDVYEFVRTFESPCFVI